MKKIITASIVAIMAVTAANADIASTTYVTSRTGDPASLTTTAKNLTGAVNELAGKISGGEITINKDQITSDMIKDGGVVTADLANGAVTTDKIVDGNVTTAKIADSAVTSAKIANGTIVDEDIAAGANIAQSKIAGLGNALAAKEDVSNKANQITGNMNKAQMYPTVSLTEELIAGANQNMSDLIGEVADGKTVVEMITEGDNALDQRVTGIEGSGYAKSGITSAKVTAYDTHVADKDIHVTTTDKSTWNAKQDKLTASNVTTTGTTGVVKAVVGSDGKLSVTKSAVATDDIADSAVTTAKIAANAVTTPKIADKNVTLGKLEQSVQTSLGKADSAMQETALKGLASWTDQKCGTTGVTCSLVSKDGTIAWEAVKY